MLQRNDVMVPSTRIRSCVLLLAVELVSAFADHNGPCARMAGSNPRIICINTFQFGLDHKILPFDGLMWLCVCFYLGSIR